MRVLRQNIYVVCYRKLIYVYILFDPLNLLLFMMNVRGGTVSFSKLRVINVKL